MRRALLLLPLFGLFAVGVWAQENAPDPRAILGPPTGKPLSGAELEAMTKEVGSLLRCPVCQGLSVADSPSTMAQQLKAQVKELLAAGYEREQVLTYFERSYGEFVRLKPPLRGVNWLVWLAPALALLAGGIVIRAVMRRGKPASPAVEAGGAAPQESLPGPDTLPEDASLVPFVLQVRALAYGWPEGRRAEGPTS